jgi:hypothetical protein
MIISELIQCCGIPIRALAPLFQMVRDDSHRPATLCPATQRNVDVLKAGVLPWLKTAATIHRTSHDGMVVELVRAHECHKVSFRRFVKRRLVECLSSSGNTAAVTPGFSFVC